MKEYLSSIRPNGLFKEADFDFFENFQTEIYEKYGYHLDKLCPSSKFWFYDKLNDKINHYNRYTHNYYIEYAKRFEGKRESALKVLEIGIYTGFSMLLWEKFFPNAQIYGIDINIQGVLFNNKNAFELCKDHERINLFEFDGTNETKINEFIKNVGGDFDIIIDDGSHLGDHQIKSLIHFLPHLKEDGIFVVEDIGLYPTGGNSFWINHYENKTGDIKNWNNEDTIHNYLEIGITDKNDPYSNQWNGIPMFEYFMKNYNNIPHNRLAKYKYYLSRENINLLDKVECNWIAPINFETINRNTTKDGEIDNFKTRGNSKMCFINYK